MTEEHTFEGLRAENDRLQRELDQASSEKIQSVWHFTTKLKNPHQNLKYYKV